MNERCKFFKWEHELVAVAAADNFPPADRQIAQHDTFAKPPVQDPIGAVMSRDMQALNEFVSLAKSRRFTCMLGSPFETMYAHREVRLVKGPYNQEDFWLVVRPTPAADAPAPAKDGVWLQMHGMRPDDEGWIISGQSHFVALQTPTEFLICNRRALWAYVDKHVLREVVATPQQADHRCFKESYNELVTWVSVAALGAWKDETIGIRTVIVDRWPRAGILPLASEPIAVAAPVAPAVASSSSSSSATSTDSPVVQQSDADAMEVE